MGRIIKVMQVENDLYTTPGYNIGIKNETGRQPY
jgi:hypothetical protein